MLIDLTRDEARFLAWQLQTRLGADPKDDPQIHSLMQRLKLAFLADLVCTCHPHAKTPSTTCPVHAEFAGKSWWSW